MGNNVKKRFTVSLDIETKDLEKQVKSTVGNLKTILADLGSASDKMGYFKELVDYIGQVDSALTTLKNKNKDAFDHMFDGLDASLKQQLESVFGTSNADFHILDVLREKLSALTAKSSIKELRNFAHDINSFYESIGASSPFTDIDKQFSGKANANHIKLLTDSLNNFATVWDGVNKKIQGGFGLGGSGGGTGGAGSGSGDVAKLSEEVQKQIDELNKKVDELEDVKSRLEKVAKTIKTIGKKGDQAIPDSYKSDLTVESVQKLMDEFDALKVQLQSGDKASTDYYNNLTRITEVVLTLKKALNDVRADESIKKIFMAAPGGRAGNMVGKLSSYANSPLTSGIFGQVTDLSGNKGIDKIINDHLSKINALKSGSSAVQKSNKNTIISYQELKNKIQEYYNLVQQYNDESLDEDSIDRIADDMEKLEMAISKLGKGKEQIESISEALVRLSTGGASFDGTFDIISKTLGVEDPSVLIEQANIKLQEFLNTTNKFKSIKSLDGVDLDKTISELELAKNELKELADQGIITEQQMNDVANAFNATNTNLMSLRGSGTGSGTGTGDGSGVGGGSGSGTPITDTDIASLENTIKSEISSLTAKLDSVLKVEVVKDNTPEIQNTIDGIKSTIDNISSYIDAYYASKGDAKNQAEINAMKGNLTQLLKYVSDFNARKIDSEYQKQELSAAILSDGTISVGYGEKGEVPWDRVASSLVANLSKSLLVDVHSHPFAQFDNGKMYANDFFSGSSGDLSAFRFSKELGASVAAMITGNIMRTIDLSKLTDSQMMKFRSSLSDIEKKYANKPGYSQFMSYRDDKIRYREQDTLGEQHRVTQAFEGLMYKAFEDIGISRDKVDQEIFKKYNLTDDKQLTELAERLVVLSKASQNALSPVERLSQIISYFNGDTTSSDAMTAFKGYTKGELTAADVFNKLNGRNYTISQDTMDSLYKIDTANEMSAVESLLTQITSILESINSSVSSIDTNTRRDAISKLDSNISDIVDISNGIVNPHLTKSIESIFDPLNISEYKSQDVLKQTDASIDDFHKSINRLFKDAYNGKLNIDELNNTLNKFYTALSHTQDAMQQIELYEDRTKEEVEYNGETALSYLDDKYRGLVNFDELQKLLYLLSQAKIDINKTKNDFKDGLSGYSVDDGQVSSLLQSIQSTLDSIYGVLQGFTGIESSGKNSAKYKEPKIETGVTRKEFSEQDLSTLNSILQILQNINSYLSVERTDVAAKPSVQDLDNQQITSLYNMLAAKLPNVIASESTLQSVKAAIDMLAEAVRTKDSATKDNDTEMTEGLNTLVNALTANVNTLKDIANGIVQHQKAQKSDTSDAQARIADPNKYKQISDVAANSVSSLGTEVEIKSLKALADGIVKVEGAFKNLDGQWEGFTVKVNEANNAVDLAIDKQAAFAKALNKAEELKGQAGSGDVKKTYSREETEARARGILDYYTEQGKNATVQLKDDGRYTVSILEEIGGLSKKVFQTFDENNDKIERTTATMSNKTLARIQELKQIAEFGHANKLLTDSDSIYKQFSQASVELESMNQLYAQSDMLSDEQIAQWNTQIELVQQLGNEVQKLIAKRKNSFTDGVFISEKKKQGATFNSDYAKLKENIDIPESFIKRINDAGIAIKNAADSDALKIAKNNWAALRKEIEQVAIEQDLYIKKSKAAGTSTKKAYGTTVSVNARAKFNSLSNLAQPYINDGSTIVSDGLAQYEASLKRLVELQSTFKKGQDLTPDQEIQFTQLKNECNEYYKALKKVIDSSDKLQSKAINPMSIMGDIPLDTFDDRSKALHNYVQDVYSTSAAIGKLNGDATELSFVVKNGDGTITHMTASLNAAKTVIASTAGDTEKATTMFGKFFDELKGKARSILTYLTSMSLFQTAWQQLRKGFEYVREIDKALTELKKVTNETDATYNKFLQTMSKTASTVGSTVSELTTMAASWARLGYSIEEAGKLAESTAILLNVSEFTDATQASEALISTMQAFQYTADQSMHVVDILNEVGNNYAISSDGIATALQDSASALMAAGNDLEQSVALIAAANKVVQDPNSVGK